MELYAKMGRVDSAPKCPYAARDITAIEKVKLFCLQIDEAEDQISLKRSHNYFYQVQGQIMITGAPYVTS